MSNSTVAVTTSSASDTTSTPVSLTDTSTSSSTTATTSSTPVAVQTTSYFTSTTSLSSIPPSTKYITSTITPTSTNAAGVTTSDTKPITVVITSTRPGTTFIGTTVSTSVVESASSTSSSPAALTGTTQKHDSSSHGLGTAGTTAIAVVIPVVVVALLLGLGIWFWRRRKQRKNAAEQRQKEMEDYTYNPNGDPTLPAIGSDAGGPQMAEDHSSGYRGWGAATGSNRKASTTLSAGHTQQLSEPDSTPYGQSSSPSGHYSDGHSGDGLMNQRDTMGSDDLGALGVGPVAGNNGGVRRGVSNASSAYSAAGRSEHSDDPPPLPHGGNAVGQAYEYDAGQNNYDYTNASQGNYGYSQHGPYGDGTYGGRSQPEAGMPIVRDVSARRNTRIQPGGAYQQGNSGIAQNF